MQAWSITDIGKKRKENQDSTFIKLDYERKLALLVVCDGMGGVNGGSEASRLAVEAFSDAVWKGTEDASFDAAALLSKAAETANSEVYTRAITDPSYMGMGTTLTAALVRENEATVINIGDSRTYHLSGDVIRQVTDDHSIAGDLFRSGRITREEYDHFPDKNIITRAVGTDSAVQSDVFKVALREGDALLLCSDGLTNMVPDKEILKMASGSDPEKACKTLVKRANKAGGKDNISVVLFRL
ncbi:MAG: Stp1/IreP family PP2C-type Ser/Thr phosphatase [Clostridia bacterium]|nr:Stp1/IreP family PP2C-type Ser/Thr phosphatase [Clostridia bacterium]